MKKRSEALKRRIRNNYARWKDRKEGEVDLVLLDEKKFKPVWSVEIKWSNRYFEKAQELSSLIQFCQQNSFQSALVTSIDVLGIKEVAGLRFTFLPAALYAYNIGVITLKRKGVELQ